MLSDSTVLSGSLVEQRFLYFFLFKKQQTLYFRTQLLRTEFNCLKAAEQLQGDSLLFTNKSAEVPGTHLIDFKRLKAWVDLGATRRT